MSQPSFDHIGVIGAGAWGTALAIASARAGRTVTLYARDARLVADIAERRENATYLPGIPLPPEVGIVGDLKGLSGASALLLVVPAQDLRETAKRIAALGMAQPIILCAKGIERGTLRLMPEVAAEILPGHPIAILSGPTFARDVALEKPTSMTLAASKLPLAQGLQQALASRTFRPYASTDVTGVAVGGAIKNVLAIACGISMGLGLGENACAALLTRGFAEMARLCMALGGKQKTLMGLSGMGDLILSATSAKSRNYAFGLCVGEGVSIKTLKAEAGKTVTEGVFTAGAAAGRAAELGVEMPVTSAVAAILEERETITDAIRRLLDRPLRPE